MGFSNFLSNLKQRVWKKNAIIHKHISLKKQYKRMMIELEENIKIAKTEEEKERLMTLRQQIIDEGKRVKNEMTTKR